MIIAIRDKEIKLNKSRKPPDVTSVLDDISDALKKLMDLYRPCCTKYLQHQKDKENKKRRTPTLNLQTKGKRIQDAHQFDISKAILDA